MSFLTLWMSWNFASGEIYFNPPCPKLTDQVSRWIVTDLDLHWCRNDHRHLNSLHKMPKTSPGLLLVEIPWTFFGAVVLIVGSNIGLNRGPEEVKRRRREDVQSACLHSAATCAWCHLNSLTRTSFHVWKILRIEYLKCGDSRSMLYYASALIWISTGWIRTQALDNVEY